MDKKIKMNKFKNGFRISMHILAGISFIVVFSSETIFQENFYILLAIFFEVVALNCKNNY